MRPIIDPPTSHIVAEMKADGWTLWHDYSATNRETPVHYVAFLNETHRLECGAKYAAHEDYDEAMRLAAIRARIDS